MGNMEAKELICTTHGCELMTGRERGGDGVGAAMQVGGGVQGGGE